MVLCKDSSSVQASFYSKRVFDLEQCKSDCTLASACFGIQFCAKNGAETCFGTCKLLVQADTAITQQQLPLGYTFVSGSGIAACVQATADTSWSLYEKVAATTIHEQNYLSSPEFEYSNANCLFTENVLSKGTGIASYSPATGILLKEGCCDLCRTHSCTAWNWLSSTNECYLFSGVVTLNTAGVDKGEVYSGKLLDIVASAAHTSVCSQPSTRSLAGYQTSTGAVRLDKPTPHCRAHAFVKVKLCYPHLFSTV